MARKERTHPQGIGPLFDELPGELFHETHGFHLPYSIHENVLYADWRFPQYYDEEALQVLIEAFELGFDGTMAAWTLRRAPFTVEGWLTRGQLVSELASRGITPHPKLAAVAETYRTMYESCMAAKTAGITRRLSRIESATDWRAQAWLLEKLVPAFSPRQMITLNVDFDKLSDEELEKLAKTGKL